ncbi:MAG: hypothetical protein QOI20_2760 [Acidimicrobiaceae bacterium]|nr:hypothetical protein [Acidimicrobiaceae bacterium]
MTRTMQDPPDDVIVHDEPLAAALPPKRRSRRRLLVAGGSALAVLAAVIGVAVASGRSSTDVRQAGVGSPADDPAAPPTTAAPAPAPAATPAPAPAAPAGAPAAAAQSCPAASANPPGPRFGSAVAIDPSGLVVVGGRASDFADKAETWAFGCGHWGNRAPSVAPPADLGAVAAYDAARGATVLLAADGTTWTWSANVWTARHPAASPPKLSSALAVYDDVRQKVLVVGSAMSGGGFEAWAWDGATWAKAGGAGATPDPRSAAALAFDSVRGTAVLFGGMPGDTGAGLSDTWTFDGSSWTKRAPAHTPPGGPATAAFDAVRANVVALVGNGETWTWNGNDWAKQAPASSPGRRLFTSMAWVPGLNRVVVFGGKVVRTASSPGTNTKADEEIVNDLWAWDGSAWSKLA